MYSVVVSNVGTVHTSPGIRAARWAFHDWRRASHKEGSRAYGETVTLTGPDGEPIAEYRARGPLPTVKALSALIRSIKRAGIGDDYRASADDDVPGVCLTVGWDPVSGDWSYQTGDNSYTGGAYGYPCWGVVPIYRRSNAADLARDIRAQLADLAADY